MKKLIVLSLALVGAVNVHNAFAMEGEIPKKEGKRELKTEVVKKSIEGEGKQAPVPQLQPDVRLERIHQIKNPRDRLEKLTDLRSEYERKGELVGPLGEVKGTMLENVTTQALKESRELGEQLYAELEKQSGLKESFQVDEAKLIELIRAGANPNSGGPGGHSLLARAVQIPFRFEKTIRALLKAGAKPDLADKSGVTPLMWAAKSGDVNAVKLLIEKRAKLNAQDEDGASPLMWAVFDPGPTTRIIIELLLEHGADPSLQLTQNLEEAEKGDTALSIAEADLKKLDPKSALTPFREANLSRAIELLRGEPYLTKLMGASISGDLDEVRRLLDAGAKVDARDKEGASSLMYAVLNPQLQTPKIVDLLLKSGADPSLQFTQDTEDAKKGETVLDIAKRELMRISGTLEYQEDESRRHLPDTYAQIIELLETEG